ncbi:hypothetical protein BDK51DRAFT_53220 [Blyttiomyces helicus]|uniref:Uncharacterized protein n=1 Tax=Blyttiomyces helicus TaxID=388810 RepID=A0A4P9WMU8_9FUNG|nr:hypothetical protein BDK51DRAFT_53220 [Blyttiomyces helicus]|eukprot:RKO94254.1 hypothetical protein BDK51DRAFT_53220 [Blyttiomyces helicus]
MALWWRGRRLTNHQYGAGPERRSRAPRAARQDAGQHLAPGAPRPPIPNGTNSDYFPTGVPRKSEQVTCGESPTFTSLPRVYPESAHLLSPILRLLERRDTGKRASTVPRCLNARPRDGGRRGTYRSAGSFPPARGHLPSQPHTYPRPTSHSALKFERKAAKLECAEESVWTQSVASEKYYCVFPPIGGSSTDPEYLRPSAIDGTKRWQAG